MKTKEQLIEESGFVRDVISWVKKKPSNDKERNFADAMFRAAFARLNDMEIGHVRRINETVCDVDYPSVTLSALTDGLMTRLGHHHNLKQYRQVKMPQITPPGPARA